MDDKIFNKILDGMKANVYITDTETDEILYMNRTMKSDFHLEHPEGQICWKVLQEGRESRCDFCPIERLKRQNDRTMVFQWNEKSSVTKHTYRNYDSLIPWEDEKIVHLQQSIDISELISANTDELTQFYTRRFGKEQLKEMLKLAQEERIPVTVCLYDINLLKEVNDSYGHAEGDRLITIVSDAVRNSLEKDELVFRLSGDEFVVAFLCGHKRARDRMEQIKENANKIKKDYKIDFCYGLAEVIPQEALSVEEILFLADKKMYEYKRQFHIKRNDMRLNLKAGDTVDTHFAYHAELLYDALVNSTEDYLYVCNMKTGIFKYTQKMVDEFDLPGQVIENAAAVWGAKVHEEDRAAFLEANQEIEDGRALSHCVEYRALNRNGEWVWVRCRGQLELDENGQPDLFAGFITNLGKKNKIDGLTGLFNKLEFQDEITHLLAGKQKFSMMLLGIDDIKNINNLYDRKFGDEVIRIISQRLLSLMTSGMEVYRLDGDEFGILARDADRDTMEKIYRVIYYSFESQQELNGKTYYSTLSGGCLFCPKDASSYEDIMKYAGYCMELSKNQGKKQCTYFSGSIPKHRSRSLEMAELLRASVENDFEGFYLVYQPLVDAVSGNILGAEALARWKNEKFGIVSPMEFIPILEGTGLIIEAGKWILKTAAAACKEWTKKAPDFIMDVNLSYKQMEDNSFLEYLNKVLVIEKLSPANLVLELTESYFVKDTGHIKAIFTEIRKRGIRVAMDDFGTGYSTLGILKDSPADIVKIDKTFIRDIDKSNFDATFIRFVVVLCHDAGIKVCLEGVEDQKTLDVVRVMGLDMIQGFYFDKPIPKEEMTEKYFA